MYGADLHVLHGQQEQRIMRQAYEQQTVMLLHSRRNGVEAALWWLPCGGWGECAEHLPHASCDNKFQAPLCGVWVTVAAVSHCQSYHHNPSNHKTVARYAYQTSSIQKHVRSC